MDHLSPAGHRQISFKLDTGAEVTAVSEEVYQSLGQGNLQRSSKALYGPACQTLEVLGQFTGELKHQEQVTSQTISKEISSKEISVTWLWR